MTSAAGSHHAQRPAFSTHDSYLNGFRRGQYEGRLEGIILALQVKFGIEGLKLYPMIANVQDAPCLRAVIAAISTFDSVEELHGFCSTLTRTPNSTSQGSQ